MFKSPTVFVIGAGASAEAKLPIGSILTQQIAGLVDLEITRFREVSRGDHRVGAALLQLADLNEWQPNSFQASGRALAEAMQLAPSIDTFLETHASNREYVLLGKLGIARAIGMAEAKSLLAPTNSRQPQEPFAMSNLAGTWYMSLAQQLFTGIPVERPDEAFENVTFIVFNYDRCLEVFLLRAVAMYFRLSAGQAQEVLSKVRIVHPYGQLGSLTEGSVDFVPYGLADLDLLSAVARIKTFSESVDRVDEIAPMLEHADTIIFLGFAFHDQNMRLLEQEVGVRRSTERVPRVFATAFKTSAADVKVIRNQIAYLMRGRPERPDESEQIAINVGTCQELFVSYWRSLTQ